MAYFLTREENALHPVGGKSMLGRPPPAPCSFMGDQYNQAPSSPLSRLVQEGSAPGGMLGSRQQGFDSAVAQDWQSSVQQTTAAHQQRNDPNFVEKRVKSHGYRVSHAPGGGSSLSLAWDDSTGDNPHLGRGAQDTRAVGGENGTAGCFGGGAWNGLGENKRQTYRDASPNTFSAGVRSASRECVASSLGGGMSHPSSRGSVREASPHRVAASFGDHAYNSRAAPSFPNAPPPAGGRRDALGREIESTSLAFGNRVDNGSSNAYACGSNQNVGNGITDRRTTRVLRPPGGASQISFG